MKDSPEQQPLKCLIVDDEQIAIKGIANHISKLDFLTVNATCSSALEARGILENQPIDLMFLDINMPYLSGIDFLKSLDEAPLTILTTAYSEYALEGYQLNVVDYLLKPISFFLLALLHFFSVQPMARIQKIHLLPSVPG